MQAAPSTLNDLLNALRELRAEEDALRSEYEARLAAIAKKVEAVQTTLELFSDESAQSSAGGAKANDVDEGTLQLDLGTNGTRVDALAKSARTLSTTAWAQELHGLTQMEALIRIAEKNGGLLRASEARRIFIAAGIAKGNTKNVGPHVYHMLSDAKQFQRVNPGRYRLVKPSSEQSST